MYFYGKSDRKADFGTLSDTTSSINKQFLGKFKKEIRQDAFFFFSLTRFFFPPLTENQGPFKLTVHL